MENVLPKNWVEIDLGSLAEIQSGGTPSRGKANFWSGNIPWVKISDIKELNVSKTEEYISQDGLKNSSARIFPSGTILFTIFATIGKVGILDFDAATNQAIAGITPNSNINKKYLIYSLIELSESLKDSGKGVAQNNINLTILRNLQIPLPPLPEQQRIVEKLDALFASHETVKKSLEKIPQILKNLRQQILTQAVTGKLTEKWRVRKNLEEWKEMKVEDIASKLGSGSTPKGGSETYRSEGIPLVRSMNVHFEGIKLDGLAFINETQANALKNVEIFENDILLNITGASIGRVCLANSAVVGGRVNQHVFIIRSIEEIVIPRFLNLVMASRIIQDFIENIKYGAGMEAISKTQIGNLNIPVPTVKEQSKIVSRVESLFVKADAIELRYKNLKEKIDQLPQALLHKAFKGELVPQLPTDGDARDLLEEISQLKNQTGGKTSQRKKTAK